MEAHLREPRDQEECAGSDQGKYNGTILKGIKSLLARLVQKQEHLVYR